MKDPVKIFGVQDESFVVLNPGHNIQVVTLPKAECAGRTIRIQNLSGHDIVIQPAPGDSFADEIHIEHLKTMAATVNQIGKSRLIWEFA